MRKMMIAVLGALAAVAAVLGPPAAPVNAAAVAGSAATGTASAPGALLLALNGVSCVSAKFCAAVGTQGHGAGLSQGDVPLTMIWNGKRWLKTAAPLPANVRLGQLDSVSCTSAAYCVAVGNAGGTDSPPLAETWNGRAWTPATLPAHGPVSSGLAVSCGAARSCAAVGFYVAPGGPSPFLETLAGPKWTVRGLPAMFAAFGGISCAAASYCVLGGSYAGPANHAVIFGSWNGEAFTPMKEASPAAFVSAITGLSCVSATTCTAIGTTAGAAGQPYGQSFAVGTWNGRAWSVTSVAGPSGVQNQLGGVSCASAASCVAVGVSSANGSQQTSRALAESYDGRSWTMARVPALPKGASSAFSAVSCVSATWCAAVGAGGGPGGQLFSGAALTGFWNGKSWRLVTAS